MYVFMGEYDVPRMKLWRWRDGWRNVAFDDALMMKNEFVYSFCVGVRD